LTYLQRIIMKIKDSKALPRWLLGFFLISGWALRLYRLGVQSLWYDETVSAFLARQSLRQLTAHTASDIHPPAYYYLLHFWTRLAGDSEYALALPSVCFSLLLIPLLYQVGRRLVGWQAAAWGVSLLTFSPFNLQYAQEVRMYTMGAALGLLALYGAMEMLEMAPKSLDSPRPDIGHGPPTTPYPAQSGSPGRRDWRTVLTSPRFMYVLAAAVGLYTLYYFAFLLLFLNLFVLVCLLLRRRPPMPAPATPVSLFSSPVASWLSAQLALVLLYLPWLLPVALRQVLNPPVPPWRSFVPLWRVLAESWTALALGQSVSTRLVWPLLLLSGGLYLLGLISFYLPRRGDRQQALDPPATICLLAGYTFAPLFFIYLASYLTPLYHVRYLFTFSPLFYLALGVGLAYLVRNGQSLWPVLGYWVWPTATLALLFTLLAGYFYSIHNFHFNSLYASDDWRGAVRFIDDHWRPGDAVLVNAGYTYPAFLYYYPGAISWRGRLSDYQSDEPGKEGPVVVQTGSIGGSANLGWGSPDSDFYATNEEETEAALRRLLAAHPRLWMLRAYDTVVDRNQFVRRWLDTHTVALEDQPFTGASNIRVQGYMSLQTPGAPTRANGAVFGQSLALRGYDEPTTSVRTGGNLDVTLYWEALERIERDYAVSLKLFDLSQDFVWAQRDELPLGSLMRTSEWPTNLLIRHPLRLAVPSGTPPGEYELRLEVYNPYTKVPLPLSDHASGGTFTSLGRVNISPPAWLLSPPPLQHERRVNFSTRLTLLGYNLSAESLKPGEELMTELFWQARTAPLDDYIITLRMVDNVERAVAVQESRPAFDRYPTTEWQAAEVVHDPHQLTVPAMSTSGTYNLVVSVYRADDGERLPVSRKIPLLGGADALTLQTVEIQGRPVQMEPPPTIQNLLEIHLGENVELVGYELAATQVSPGDKLKLTLYWHARGVVGRNFKVFNHLVGPDGAIWGQRDSMPGDGTLPTAGWQPGEYLADTYEIPVKSDAPPGSYSLLVGMYDEGSGARLPAFDSQDQPLGDHVVLSEIEVIEKR
jgi:hypothetical protein